MKIVTNTDNTLMLNAEMVSKFHYFKEDGGWSIYADNERLGKWSSQLECESVFTNLRKFLTSDNARLFDYDREY